jgi:hypothetical protein
MDVATWLRGLDLERHEAAFRDNLIDMMRSCFECKRSRCTDLRAPNIEASA